MIIFLFVGIHLFAQDNKKISNSESLTSGMKEFDINGIKVIYRPALNNVVIAKLFISGGTKNYKADKQGIESLTLDVLTDQGSKKYAKDLFHDMIEEKGISITSSAGYDYSTITLRTLDMNWSLAWDIFQDVLINPGWDAQTFEKDKGQQVAGLQDQMADPDQTVQRMVMKDLFKGKPYESNPQGTVDTVQAFTFEQVKDYYQQLMRRKKLCLVVIGKIDPKDLEEKVKGLSVLPEGKEEGLITETPLINKSTISYRERELATNYIMGAYGSAPAGTREKTAMNLGTEILNDRLFVEIRTKRNLSYAPAAIQVPLFDPYNLLYVSTVKPNESAQVMIDELKKMKKEGVTEKELRNKKEAFLTNLYMAQESNDAQAEIIGSLDYTRGWQYYDVLKADIYSITKSEVDNAYKKYVNGINWQYLGTKSLVNEKIFLQPLQ